MRKKMNKRRKYEKLEHIHYQTRSFQRRNSSYSSAFAVFETEKQNSNVSSIFHFFIFLLAQACYLHYVVVIWDEDLGVEEMDVQTNNNHNLRMKQDKIDILTHTHNMSFIRVKFPLVLTNMMHFSLYEILSLFLGRKGV